MKLEIKLLSDLCTYSGETYNSIVDTDVAYDKYGIPYISARRLKGCIREAALELKEFGLIKQEEYDEIFGAEGNKSAAFSLSNAHISDYEEVVKALEQCKYEELKTPENVLKQYTYIRKQTAVDLETGVADKNSLRVIRVIRKNLVFKADCNWLRTVSRPEVLGQAISLVKHIGLARTRGLGLVEMALSEEAEKKTRHVLLDKSKLAEQNKIRYTIQLKEPMICKSPQGDQTVTEDYIAGSKVLGMIAGALGKAAYQKLMSGDGEVIVSNGYIMNQETRCLPASISLQKEKDQSYDADGKIILKNMLLAASSEIKNKQMTPANIMYMDENGVTTEVTTEISYHHQRPEDKSVGRATGTDGSSFYQLSAISAGQSFCGYIYAGRQEAEQIIDAVDGLKEVRMGYGKTSEFGGVTFTLDSLSEASKDKEVRKDAIAILASDMLLYNEQGMVTTDIHVLEKELQKVTGVSDLAIHSPFLRFATIGGYNTTWQRRKPILYAFGKGSAFLLHSDGGFDIRKLDGTFIGERVSEGYGEIHMEVPKESADVCITKRGEVAKEGAEGAFESEILQHLLQTEFERRIEEAVREKVEKSRNTYKKQAQIMNAAVSKLRLILKNESSYESMKYQVESIEKEEKNSLCQKIVELVQPSQISKQVTETMRELYTSTFTNQWTEEKLFKVVYHSYLAELKYFVKSME